MKTEITLRGEKKSVESVKETLEQRFDVEWGEPFQDLVFDSVSLLGRIKREKAIIQNEESP